MANTFGKHDYLVSSFDKPKGLKDPIKPWLFDLHFTPNNSAALTSVSGLWSAWNSPNHIRCYAKSAATHGRKLGTVSVPFFGISHKYPGKPEVAQSFTVQCTEHENMVMIALVEKWMNLITNTDENLKTPNSSMYASAETIWDLSCTVDIKNRGINGKYLPRYTSYTCAWPSDVSAGTLADMNTESPPTRTITFTYLLALAPET